MGMGWEGREVGSVTGWAMGDMLMVPGISRGREGGVGGTKEESGREVGGREMGAAEHMRGMGIGRNTWMEAGTGTFTGIGIADVKGDMGTGTRDADGYACTEIYALYGVLNFTGAGCDRCRM